MKGEAETTVYTAASSARYGERVPAGSDILLHWANRVRSETHIAKVSNHHRSMHRSASGASSAQRTIHGGCLMAVAGQVVSSMRRFFRFDEMRAQKIEYILKYNKYNRSFN